MFYKYDIHLHSDEGSPCGKAPARDLPMAYKNGGYSGFVLTDHFYKEHILSAGSYKDGVMRNYNAYLAAKKEGDKIGVDVFFGIEYRYCGDDFLTYGIGLDFLLSNEDIFDIDFAEYSRRVHEAGGFIIQAHPFRNGKRPVVIQVPYIDAIEIFNASHHNTESRYPEFYNDLAEHFAREMGIIGTAGSDTHDIRVSDNTPYRKGSMLFKEKVKNEKHLIELIKENKFGIYKY